MSNESLILEFGKEESITDLGFDNDGFITLSVDEQFSISIENLNDDTLFIRLILCEMNQDKAEDCICDLLSINMKLINSGAYIYWDKAFSKLGICKTLSSKDISAKHLSLLVNILLLEAQGIMSRLEPHMQ